MPSPARAERAVLLEALTQAGPEAPTLCGTWTTHDLAAHLVARERAPLALPGLVAPALHGVTGRYERAERRRPYEDLLARLRRGAPVWSPLGSPVDRLYDLANLHEFFVHAEDVRRPAGLGPRTLPREVEDALWSRLRLLGRGFTRRAGDLGVEVVTPDARSAVLRPGTGTVVVRGRVGEAFLWLWGRGEVAEVELDGPPAAVERLRATRVGP